MKGYQHIIFGASIGVCTYLVTIQQDPSLVGTVCAVTAGSILPDIDNPESKLGRIFTPISLPLSIIGHRTITHDPIFIGLLYLLSYVFLRNMTDFYLINMLFIGIASHLLLDATTITGIPLCYVINKNYIHAMPRTLRPKTDGISAFFVTIICCLVLYIITAAIISKF